jgi:very-short-patch-repair endonuclease
MPDAGPFKHAIRAQKVPPDVEIAELAERQRGVVAHRQLVQMGLGRGEIWRRLDAGRLHALHRGVYAVGHRRLPAGGHWMAAVLACGPTALLSHRSAAALWGIRPTAATRVDVTHAGRTRHNRSGIAVHRPRRLHEEDSTVRDGIPVTSISRTLLDLAAVVRPRQLAKAVEAAERLRVFDLTALERQMDRSPRRAGLRSLRAALHEYVEPPFTRSGLERRFFDLCRKVGLPRPQTNVFLAGQEVDVLWPEQRVVVELDTRDYHQTSAAFERDRRRDATLQLAGYRVLRVTDRRLAREPHAVLGMLRALLSRSQERPGGAPGAGVPARRAGPAC